MLARRLQNVVQLLGCNLTKHPFFIVMEFVEGWSLQEEIRRSGAVPVPRIQLWSEMIVMGLKHLHTSKLLHRDLKSSNVMLHIRRKRAPKAQAKADDGGDAAMGSLGGTCVHRARLRSGARSDSFRGAHALEETAAWGGAEAAPPPRPRRASFSPKTGIPADAQVTAKIVDFGETKNLSLASPLTKEVGTWKWMAPEVMGFGAEATGNLMEGNVTYGTAADVYSLGMVLYEMVAGHEPFKGYAPMQAAFSGAMTGGRARCTCAPCSSRPLHFTRGSVCVSSAVGFCRGGLFIRGHAGWTVACDLQVIAMVSYTSTEVSEDPRVSCLGSVIRKIKSFCNDNKFTS